jgi:hypothetical protein
MPLWGTLLLWRLHSQNFQFYDLLKHGEFALYAAAFLAPSLQVIASNIKNTKYVLGAGTVFLLVTGLVVAVLIYSGVQPPQNVDLRTLTNWSSSLLIASVLFSVFVTLVEHQMLQPDLGATEDEELADLSSRLEGKLPPSNVDVSHWQVHDEPHELSEEDLAEVFNAKDAGVKSEEGGDANG